MCPLRRMAQLSFDDLHGPPERLEPVAQGLGRPDLLAEHATAYSGGSHLFASLVPVESRYQGQADHFALVPENRHRKRHARVLRHGPLPRLPGDHGPPGDRLDPVAGAKSGGRRGRARRHRSHHGCVRWSERGGELHLAVLIGGNGKLDARAILHNRRVDSGWSGYQRQQQVLPVAHGPARELDEARIGGRRAPRQGGLRRPFRRHLRDPRLRARSDSPEHGHQAVDAEREQQIQEHARGDHQRPLVPRVRVEARGGSVPSSDRLLHGIDAHVPAQRRRGEPVCRATPAKAAESAAEAHGKHRDRHAGPIWLPADDPARGPARSRRARPGRRRFLRS
jgi:hypothetical protein